MDREQIARSDAITLREYIEARISHIEKAMAITEAATCRRFDNVSELVIRPMLEDIKSLRESRAQLEGKATQQSVNVALILALIGIMVGIVSIFKT